ncbi:hypothetical protein BDC45DRAFT_27771 [Circinella umbellata]|nr:hypothetical protein BDC45DRAFT_27771 [Circinella umbellata]
MVVSCLHFDILSCIAEHLDAKSILELSSCCRSFYNLGRFDLLWKRLCQIDYHLTYNHPEQTYYNLYRQTFLRQFGRRPCYHLSNIHIDEHLVKQSSWDLPLLNQHHNLNNNTNIVESWIPYISCCSPEQHDSITTEKLFLCMDCHKLFCDRHSRIHTKVNHALFFKPSTAEIFCQSCVDWVTYFS